MLSGNVGRPLVVDGWVIAEKGSRLEGRVVEAPVDAEYASRLRIELVKLSTSDGQHVQIRTDPYKSAEIPLESRISFRIVGPVTITERLN